MPSLRASVLPADASPGLAFFQAQRLRKQAEKDSKGKAREVDYANSTYTGNPYKRVPVNKFPIASVQRVVYPPSSKTDADTELKHNHLSIDKLEELVWHGCTLVWSKGTAIHKVYNFQEGDQTERVVQQALFAAFQVPAAPTSSKTSGSVDVSTSSSHTPSIEDSTLYGLFPPAKAPPWSDDNTRATLTSAVAASLTSDRAVRCLCIVFAESIHIHYPDGQSRIVHLKAGCIGKSNKIRQVWPLQVGLLLELEEQETLRTSCPDWIGSHGPPHSASHALLYALDDPLEDYKPVHKCTSLLGLAQFESATNDGVEEWHTSGSTSLFSDTNEHVIYTSSSLSPFTARHIPFLVTANHITHKISIWAYGRAQCKTAASLEVLQERMVERLSQDRTVIEEGISGIMNSTQITGKRRRGDSLSNQNNLGPLLSDDDHENGILPKIGPRRSSILDGRLRQTNPSATTAQFLTAMGAVNHSEGVLLGSEGNELPFSTHRGHPRRTSTAAASNLMDRRVSATRNELSVSLDRMALHAGASHPPRAVGGDATSAARLLAESEDYHGHGEIEREASFQISSYQRDPIRSDVFISRVCATDVGKFDLKGTTSFQVHTFAEKPGSCQLAICLPSARTSYLYRLDYKIAAMQDGGIATHSVKLACSPQRQIDSISIINIQPFDWEPSMLLSLSSQKRLQVHSREAVTMALDVESGADYLYDRLLHCSGSSVELEGDNGQRRVRVSLDVRARTPMAVEVLRTGHAFLPRPLFSNLLMSFLETRSKLHPFLDLQVAERRALRTAYNETLGLMFKQKTHDELQAMELDNSHVSTILQQDSNTSFKEAELVLLVLCLLSEEWKIIMNKANWVKHISPVLADLAQRLGLSDWYDYAIRNGSETVVPAIRGRPSSYKRQLGPPFDVYKSLRTAVLGRSVAGPFSDFQALTGSDTKATEAFPVLSQVLDIYQILSSDALIQEKAGASPVSERVLLYCANKAWTREDVANLVPSVQLPILESIRECQFRPQEHWPRSMYELLDRQDYAFLLKGGRARKTGSYNIRKRVQYGIEEVCDTARNIKPISHPQHHVRKRLKDKATRFSSDLRLEEVHRMLHYTSPVILRLPSGPDVTEANIPEEQQKILTSYSNRTLALPVGNAMFLFRAAARPRSQATSVPKIELSAKFLPQPTIVALSAESLSPEQKTWPYFHSGVAVALHVAWEKDDFDSSEYAFNKPHELNARHAGFLLGLGLTGQIRSLGTFQAFKYMDPKHEYTSVGLLLGLGTAYLGTSDPKVTSALSVHIPALHPQSSMQLHVGLLIQSAALVGLGFVHIASGNRKLADSILKDMTRMYLSGTEHPDGCREGYTIASAFAYGLIMLGRGHHEFGPGSSNMLSTFRYLLNGGRSANIPGAGKDVEGELDVAVTSPAAGIALALSCMRSNRSDLADMLEIPQSVDRLDHVRSDLILLRTVCRQLILWDDIGSTKPYIESLVPAFIKASIAKSQKSGVPIPYDQELAYWNIVAGACLSIGLKYAGSAKGEAHSTIIEYLDKLVKVAASNTVTASLRSKLTKHSLQNCISVVALALAALMAGTGELNALRRLRVMHGQVSDATTYGTHLASHMALGILFLGKGRYTFGNSKMATAALFCAFYPVFPSTTTSNRFHLQAFRHLWVLAVERRCLIVKDVDTNKSVYLPVKLRLQEHGSSDGGALVTSQKMVAPTLVPAIQDISAISSDSPRYWPVSMNFRKSTEHLTSFIASQTLFVKRKAGHLSYLQDPRGMRTVFTQSKSEGATIVSDTGTAPQLLAIDFSTLWKLIYSFTSFSPIIQAEVHYIRAHLDSSSSTQSFKNLSAFMATSIMESLTTDKSEAPVLYTLLYDLLNKAQRVAPPLFAIDNVVLATRMYTEPVLMRGFPHLRGKQQALIRRDFLDHASALLAHRTNTLLLDEQVAQAFTAYICEGRLATERKSVVLLLALLQAPSLDVIQQILQLATSTNLTWQGDSKSLRDLLQLVISRVLYLSEGCADTRLVRLLVEALSTNT